MTRVNDSSLILSRNSRNNDSSLLVRIETYSSSDSHDSISSNFVPIIIIVFESSESEGFFSGSLDIETSLNDSSFNIIVYDDDVGGDRAVSSTPSPSAIIGDLSFPTLTTPNMEVDALNREET